MLGPPLLPRNLEASVRDLSSTKASVRASAVEDLVRHARSTDEVRDRAAVLFTKMLQDQHPAVRAAVAIALGELRVADALAALLVAVEDEDAHVRQMALLALGEIGDARALPRLRRALGDGRPEVRYQAIIAFARVADSTNDGRSSEVDDALFEAASDADAAVAHIAFRVAEERLGAGRAPDGRLIVRARALLSANGTSPHVALVAAILLAKSGDAGGHDLILRAVRGETIGGQVAEKEDEQAAVELVGELGLVQAVPHLERRAWGVARFVRDTCPFHARIALARLGHDRARKEIMSELASSRREVLSGAVVSAGRARMTEARGVIAKLTSAMVDPDLTREALALLDTVDAAPRT